MTKAKVANTEIGGAWPLLVLARSYRMRDVRFKDSGVALLSARALCERVHSYGLLG